MGAQRTLGNVSGRMLLIAGVALAALLFAAWFATPAFAEEAAQTNPDSTSQTDGSGDSQNNLTTGTPENQTPEQTADPSANQAAEQTQEPAAEDSPTQPFTGKGTYYIQLAKKKNKVLGMKDGKRTDGVGVVVSKKKATNLQKFKIASAGNGLFYVQNVATGRLLTADIPAEKQTGKAIMKMKSYDKKFLKNYQKWQIDINKTDKTVTFTNVATGSRLSLAGKKTSNGTKLKLAKAADQTYQKFILKKATKSKKEIVTIGVPCYMQNPQLPTGCESVALTNALNYWGFHLSKTTIASRWMPYGDSGITDFIGSPYDSSGWIICAPGITDTANRYLNSKSKDVTATNVSGTSLKGLRKYLDKGYPVVVWTTMYMGSPWNHDGSGVVDGHRYPLYHNNHAVVLCGYNPKTGAVQVADSLSGRVWRKGSSFAWIYNTMGKQAVVLHDSGIII